MDCSWDFIAEHKLLEKKIIYMAHLGNKIELCNSILSGTFYTQQQCIITVLLVFDLVCVRAFCSLFLSSCILHSHPHFLFCFCCFDKIVLHLSYLWKSISNLFIIVIVEIVDNKKKYPIDKCIIILRCWWTFLICSKGRRAFLKLFPSTKWNFVYRF